MAGRQRHRTERTREAFLRAAREMLAEKGYSATSIPDVVGRAGRAQGTFYLHFANKQDIFTALLARLADAVDTCSSATPAGVREVFTRHLQLALDHRDLWLLLDEMAIEDSGARSLRQELRAKVEASIVSGLLRSDATGSPERAGTGALLAGMVLRVARVGELPASLEVTTAHMTAVAARALHLSTR